jgi:23S rRNA pseudouridine2605 synthase
MEERLQKLMAQAGLGSRRDCEELISAGRVIVNGKRAELGQKADPSIDRILVDGVPLKAPEAYQYIALYKPRNVLTTVESPDPRQTVRDLVPVPGTLYPVGRLDVDSEGLVLLTNDGDLANRLTHPRYAHEKEYKVLVARRPDDEQLDTWRRGVVLEDGHRTLPAQVIFLSAFGQGAWLKVILREGRKRQIREVGSLIGLPVVRIIRTRISTLHLGRLKPGEWRPLTPEEVSELKGESLPRPPTRRPNPRYTRQGKQLPSQSGKGTRTPAVRRSYQRPSSSASVNRKPQSRNSGPHPFNRKPRKPSSKT